MALLGPGAALQRLAAGAIDPALVLPIGYPPQLPGVAGFPVGYHFGTDLVRAAALRWARVDPYDAIARFDVTLGALALLLAVRAAARAAGASSLAVTLAGWTLIATDFS